MSTKTRTPVKFKGLCRWANIPPNAARKPFTIDPAEPDNTNYSIEVECSEEQFKKLKKEGLSSLTQLKTDEETGKTYLKIKATKQKRDMIFADPFVVDINNTPYTSMLANGSEVVVIAELEKEPGKYTALRLKGVQVINGIEFVKKNPYADLLETANEDSSDADSDMF